MDGDRDKYCIVGACFLVAVIIILHTVITGLMERGATP